MTTPLLFFSFHRSILACLIALLMGAVAPGVSAQNTLLEHIKKTGKLQVGFSSFLPWAMRDKQGQWIGFEIDVATKLTQDLGLELQLIPTAWDAIIPSLIAGKYDVIIGGMTITPARKEQIDFTLPYSNSGQGIVASKALASSLRWPEGYNSPQVTWTCRRGATPCKLIKERWPKATLRQFDDDNLAFQEVINGNAHASMSNEPKPSFMALKFAAQLFKPTEAILDGGEEGFGLKKSNPAALKFFNDWITRNKNWLKTRHDYWFKSQDWAKRITP
jgi:polar amino acid transport system substrate-binding protein